MHLTVEVTGRGCRYSLSQRTAGSVLFFPSYAGIILYIASLAFELSPSRSSVNGLVRVPSETLG